jgi:hypothetical protein
LEWQPIVQLICNSIVASVEEVQTTYAALGKLPSIWHLRVQPRQGSTAHRALELLPAWPVLTVDRLAELLRVSFQAANEAVKVLANLGILTERTGYKKNRLSVAPDVLRILNRPFGQPPVLEEGPFRLTAPNASA